MTEPSRSPQHERARHPEHPEPTPAEAAKADPAHDPAALPRVPTRRKPSTHEPGAASRPRARRTSLAVQRPYANDGTLADHLFFVASGVVSVWLGISILFHGASFGWGWYVVVLLVGWAIAAYLTLPRLHRILTSIYVPNYFIGRARTSDGLLGDPVNLALVGTESQLHIAMEQAGWTRADEITLQSTWRIVASTITRRSYDEAPVSPLFLFGRKQDFAYQQEVDGNPGKRHHVRFWRCPDGWLLPGGRQVEWLAAGTYDRAVGFSLFTLQVTHKIDENTDIERDHIVASMSDANDDVRVTVIEDFSTGYHSRNGGGDTIITDGDLPIVDVRSLPIDEAAEQRTSRALVLDATSLSEETPNEVARDLWKRRPLALMVGCALATLAAIVGVLRFLWHLQQLDTLTEFGAEDLTPDEAAIISSPEFVQGFWITVLVASAVVVVLQLVLSIFAAQGAAGARLMLMTVLLVAAVGTLTLANLEAVGRIGLLIDLSTMLMIVAALLALSSTASRQFVAAKRWRKRRKRGERRELKRASARDE